MTLVAGHQPNLYPYGGFFSKMASVDKFVIVDNTQYVKKQYHNRNRIKLPGGETIWLNIPVKTAGRFNQAINAVETDNIHNWREKHKKTIERSYRKAPFFEIFYPELEELLARDWKFLANFNIEFIRTCAAFLEIDTQLLTASEANIFGKSTGLIIDICRKTGADSYLHGKHSLDYVDFKAMDSAGIKSFIQDFHAIEYPQNASSFTPNLSILDIIFNCGKKAKHILNKSTTINSWTQKK